MKGRQHLLREYKVDSFVTVIKITDTRDDTLLVTVHRDHTDVDWHVELEPGIRLMARPGDLLLKLHKIETEYLEELETS